MSLTEYYAHVDHISDIAIMAAHYPVWISMGDEDGISFKYEEGKIIAGLRSGAGAALYCDFTFSGDGNRDAAMLKAVYNKYEPTVVKIDSIPDRQFMDRHKVFVRRGAFSPLIALDDLLMAGVRVNYEMKGTNIASVYVLGDTEYDHVWVYRTHAGYSDDERQVYKDVYNLWHATFDI